MIDRVIGQVAKLGDGVIVVMVGGVGLSIRVPKTVLETVHGTGEVVTLFTHLIVREDDLSLYGFIAEEERALFEVLLSVSGVGARTAIAILGTLSMEQLRSAVTREEAGILTRVPGIGKKTAEKIVFELKGKLRPASYTEQLAAISDTDADVIAALTSLGYSIVEAQTALQAIPRDAPKDVETRIMLALGYFSS
ncbi:MAG TPA: Holliday junction branch migration protein RuvA [Aggregatilineales bacterium]|nr:Holliday junction branch migration protein RuvA [Anaerolineales bacterium]HRE48909.1 Holliday junction branch migration protein RuvA [Aggregatilineales bacterium]